MKVVDVAALVISCVSLVVAAGAVWYARAQVGRAAVTVALAERAARTAARGAVAEELALAQTRTQRHHELGPELPAVLQTTIVESGDRRALYLRPVTPDREYTARITTFTRDGSRWDSPLTTLRPGHYGPIRLGPSDGFGVQRVEFDLWPAGDGAAGWRCGCGAPETPGGGGPHWRHVATLGYTDIG